MAAQKGRSFLLQIDDGAGGFISLAACRSNSITLNNSPVDVTTKTSTGWRDMLVDAGIQMMSLTASGIFEDSSSEEILRSAAFSRTAKSMKLLFPNGDDFQGSFVISTYERAGEHADAETFNVTLESSGVITYTGS